MHQSIPPAPSPPPPPPPLPLANPGISLFFFFMDELEHLSCHMPGGGDESRGRMPRPRDRFNASFHFRTLQQIAPNFKIFGSKTKANGPLLVDNSMQTAMTFLIFIVQKLTVVVKTDILSVKRSSKFVSFIVMIRNT